MKLFLNFLIITLFFCSCSKDKDESGTNFVPLPPFSIAIVDSALNDRFNPESPSYFGEEYIKQIDVLSPNVNTNELVSLGKMDYLRTWLETDTHCPPELLDKIVGLVAPTGYLFSSDYYSIPLFTPGCLVEDGQCYGYLFVRYPEGNEDELKFDIRTVEGGGNNLYLFKIWVNGELAYEMGSSKMDGRYDYRYFNPKYYPFTVPDYDKNGVFLGMLPKEAKLLFITK